MTVLDLYRLLHIQVVSGHGDAKVYLSVSRYHGNYFAEATSVTRDDETGDLEFYGYDGTEG